MTSSNFDDRCAGASQAAEQPITTTARPRVPQSAASRLQLRPGGAGHPPSNDTSAGGAGPP